METNMKGLPQKKIYNEPEVRYIKTTFCYWIYLAGFFLILFLPVFTLPNLFLPLDWGRTIVFRIVFSLLFFLFIGQAVFKKMDFGFIKEKVKSVSLLFWLLSALFGVYLLATIFSIDPHYSLWGDPNRAGGFINFAFYIVFGILTFLIIRPNTWQKIWDFSIIIGVLVSIVAIFQQFGIFSKFFIPFEDRPGSTIGNPIFLATYLLLLSFLALSFGIKSKKIIRKIFYFSSLLLFLFVSIILTQSRGAFIGLLLGSFWFLFFYPKKFKKIKISAAIILLFLVIGMKYLDSHFYLLENQPHLIKSAVGRMISVIEGPKVGESRVSAWIISWQAVKERPILGYGPENFYLAFNKYYDPSLPRLGPSTSGGWEDWWDRAHNFMFDTSLTAGIPALMIYLFLLGFLFYYLQKIKNKNPETALLAHGVQATFLGYLAANFFSFDTFSSYLLFFLLLGYSFHLINSLGRARPTGEALGNSNPSFTSANGKFKNGISDKLYKYRFLTISILFVFLILFIGIFNVRPLFVNKNLTMAALYAQTGNCSKAIDAIKSPAPSTIIDSYLYLSYATVIHSCSKKIASTEKENLTELTIELLKKNVEINPHNVRNWLILAEYTNILLEEKTRGVNTAPLPVNAPEIEKLKSEANSYFEKAAQLSPKRAEIYREWAKTGLITEDYQKAEEKTQLCINLTPDWQDCYWLMTLIQGYSKNQEKFNYFFDITKEKTQSCLNQRPHYGGCHWLMAVLQISLKNDGAYDYSANIAIDTGYQDELEKGLQQLSNMYIKNNNYPGLAETYPKLILITSYPLERAQIQSSLAFIYKELGEIEKARKEALKILELIPYLPKNLQEGAKRDVEAFLKSLE